MSQPIESGSEDESDVQLVFSFRLINLDWTLSSADGSPSLAESVWGHP